MARSAVTLPNLKKSGITGIKELRDTVGHIIDKTGAEALKEVFYQAGMVLFNRLDAVIPAASKGNKAFPPGTLRRGLFITRGKENKANVVVGISGKGRANYPAIWLEHGTYKQPPRPFFRPAVLASKAEMASIIANGINNAIDTATQ